MLDNIENWKNEMQKLSFEEYAQRIKEKILNDNNADEITKQYFLDCFDYVFKLYNANKPLELNLLKIYLEQVKNYKNIKPDIFITTVLLLSYCGFNFKFNKK